MVLHVLLLVSIAACSQISIRTHGVYTDLTTSSTTAMDNITEAIIRHKFPTINESLYLMVSTKSPSHAYIFNTDGHRLGKSARLFTSKTIAVKDTLLMYTSAYFDSNQTKIILQYDTNNHTIAFVVNSSVNGNLRGLKSLNKENSSMVIVAGNTSLWNFDMNVGNVSGSPINHGEDQEVYGLVTCTGGNILVGYKKNKFTIHNPSNLSVLFNLTHGITGDLFQFKMNNLNDTEIYCVSSSDILRSFEVSLSSQINVSQLLNISPYGERTTPVNVGTYNYLIMIPSNNNNTQILLIDKLQFNITSTFKIPNLNVAMEKWSITDFDRVYYNNSLSYIEERYYFAIGTQNVSFNILSYYLTIDNCTNRSDNDICTSCLYGTYLTDRSSINNTCLLPDNFPPFYGVDNTTISRCIDDNCIYCKMNYAYCTVCDTSNGYSVSQGKCTKPNQAVNNSISLSYTSRLNDIKKEEVHWSVVLLPSPSPSLYGVSKIITDHMKNNMNYSFNIHRKSDGKKHSAFKTGISSSNESIILDLILTEENGDEEYSIDVVVEGMMRVFSKEAVYSILIYVDQYKLERKNGVLMSEMKEAEMVGGLSRGSAVVGDTSSSLGFSLGFFFLSVDPTGTFFKVTKVMQYGNKLYYININHGEILDAFLLKTASIMQDKMDTKRPQFVFNSNSYRGKMSKQRTTTDFVDFMGIKIALYLFSWALQGLKTMMMINCVMSKKGIYFCHFSNKLHLIVFNLVFLDVIWLAPRTLFYSRDIPIHRYQLSILMAVLIQVDIIYIYSYIVSNNSIIVKAYKTNRRIRTLVLKKVNSNSEGKTGENQSGEEPSGLPKSRQIGTQPPRPLRPRPQRISMRQEKSQKPKEVMKGSNHPNKMDSGSLKKEIDIKSTYEEIDFNIHLMLMTTSHLRIDLPAFQSLGCRLLTFSMWIRIPVMQLIISSLQYANTLAIGSLSVLEIGRLMLTMHTYMKYRHMKSMIYLCTDILQSLCLTIYMMNILLVSNKRYDEQVGKAHQYIGMYSIMIAFTCEYSLMFIHVILQVVRYFMMRREMKKDGLELTEYSVIIYHDDDLIPMKVEEVKDRASIEGNEIGIDVREEVLAADRLVDGMRGRLKGNVLGKKRVIR